MKTVEEIAHEIYEKPLLPAEFERRVREILADDEEQNNIAELIAWFTKRYPTPEARLRYVRRHTPKRVTTHLPDPG
jgi:hypothetical protein